MSWRVLFVVTASLLGFAQAQEKRQPDNFQVRSTTFVNGTAPLPVVMVNNIIVNGVNSCTSDFRPGGNQSPELSWTGVLPGTASFAVEMWDADAIPGCVPEYWTHDPARSITCHTYHWGIYGISPNVTELPQNASAAGSKYGRQVINDFSHARYDGPCQRPNTGRGFSHGYGITVYDLDITLDLPPSATVKELHRALMEALAQGHLLASTVIGGRYPATVFGNVGR